MIIVSSLGCSPASSWQRIQLGEQVSPWRTQTWLGVGWGQQSYQGMRGEASSARQGPERELHQRVLQQRRQPRFDLQER